jgi:hypothetical protein
VIIATRTLYIKAAAGSPRGFDIRVYQPEKVGTSWQCRYEIDWPRGLRKSAAQGVDGVQALTIALQKIGTELYTSAYHRDGTLGFETTRRGYGFPVPKPLRAQLVGDDAIFDGD